MSKGGGSTQVVQKADPWKPAQPALQGILSGATNWYNSGAGTSPYPYSTVVPFSPMTEQALGMTANRAVTGSPVTQAADSLSAKTLNGDFLNPASNPWLSGTYDLAAGKVRSSLDSEFNKGGATDPTSSSLNEGAMASNLNDLATQIYGGAYSDERNRQTQALALAPQTANQDYSDFEKLLGVGSAYESQAGAGLQDSINRYDFANQEPLQRLMQLLGIVQPISGSGGTSTQTQSGGSNGLSSILGGASSTAGLLQSLGLLGGGAAGISGAASTGSGLAAAALALA